LENRPGKNKKDFFYSFQKKFGSAYAHSQSPRKCWNIEILAKIEGKQAIFFFRKLTKGVKGFDLGQKNSKLSHACLPLTQDGYHLQFSPPVLFWS
jgi:hypothetical protein